MSVSLPLRCRVGGGCKSLEARLTRAALGDDGKGGGYALSLKSQVLTPCKTESVNSASPVMMSLKNKIFVSCDEVGASSIHTRPRQKQCQPTPPPSNPQPMFFLRRKF